MMMMMTIMTAVLFVVRKKRCYERSLGRPVSQSVSHLTPRAAHTHTHTHTHTVQYERASGQSHRCGTLSFESASAAGVIACLSPALRRRNYETLCLHLAHPPLSSCPARVVPLPETPPLRPRTLSDEPPCVTRRREASPDAASSSRSKLPPPPCRRASA